MQQQTTITEQANQQDRVREHSPEHTNRSVDRDTLDCMEALASSDREDIDRHIRELDHEWDVERYLETNASILALSGVVLGAAVNRKFLLIPGVVFSFFLQHAVQGWCPPVPVFRRLGVRTRKEINRERYALKALRGDFDNISSADGDVTAERLSRR